MLPNYRPNRLYWRPPQLAPKPALLQAFLARSLSKGSGLPAGITILLPVPDRVRIVGC